MPTSIRPLPNKYEMCVARILAQKFQSDVLFVPPTNSLHIPDLQVVRTGEFWEIKNIRGNGKFTIEDNLRKASKQSNNVVISLLRAAMTTERASSCIRCYMKHARITKHVVLVTKHKKTVDFYA